jgi:hypothetical protein
MSTGVVTPDVHPIVRVRVGGEVAEAILHDAIKHYRRADDHVIILLRRVLGLPLPGVPGAPEMTTEAPPAPQDCADART